MRSGALTDTDHDAVVLHAHCQLAASGLFQREAGEEFGWHGPKDLGYDGEFLAVRQDGLALVGIEPAAAPGGYCDCLRLSG